MLNIIYCYRDRFPDKWLELIRDPDGWFKYFYEPEWFRDPIVKQIVMDIDKTEVLGQTEQHEKIAFKAERSTIGTFVNVKITELSGNTFRGVLS